jgi:hypothetical protein
MDALYAILTASSVSLVNQPVIHHVITTNGALYQMMVVQYVEATDVSLPPSVKENAKLTKIVGVPQMAAPYVILTASSVFGLLPHAIHFAPLMQTARKVPTIAYCATLFENYVSPHCPALTPCVHQTINVLEHVMEPQFVIPHKKSVQYPFPIMEHPALKTLTVWEPRMDLILA